MPRAVLKNGVICPLENLPSDWSEGQELNVEAIGEVNSQDIDSWYSQLEEMVANNDPKDFERIESSLRIADQQAKEIVRKQMGLP